MLSELSFSKYGDISIHTDDMLRVREYVSLSIQMIGQFGTLIRQQVCVFIVFADPISKLKE